MVSPIISRLELFVLGWVFLTQAPGHRLIAWGTMKYSNENEDFPIVMSFLLFTQSISCSHHAWQILTNSVMQYYVN